jgi:hypothetical protein
MFSVVVTIIGREAVTLSVDACIDFSSSEPAAVTCTAYAKVISLLRPAVKSDKSARAGWLQRHQRGTLTPLCNEGL